MTQGTKRLTEELHRLEGLKLREILDEMAKTGSPTVVLSFNGTQEKPVAAVALITGPDTADRIQALEKPNQVAVPEGWRLSRIALDQVEIITPAGEKHWVESNSDDHLELVLYALIDAMLTAAQTAPAGKPNEWPDGQIGVRWRAIRILKTLRDGLDDSFSDQGALITEADKVIRALRSGPTDGEMDELRADAERYRWLRNPDNFGPDEGEGPSGWEQLCDLAGDDFDAFIDERMKQDHGAAEDA